MNSKQDKIEYLLRSIEQYVDAKIEVSKEQEKSYDYSCIAYNKLNDARANLRESVALAFDVELN